jgi:hypothetical protein
LKQWIFLLYGLGFVGLFLALQYIACRFRELIDAYIRQWTTRVGLPALPGTLAWLASAAGLLCFIEQLSKAVDMEAWEPFWVGLGVWGGSNLVAWALVHPGLTNVTVEKDTRGPAEALDLLAYLTKLVLRLVSVVFGLGVLGGAVWLVVAIVGLFQDEQYDTAKSALLYLSCVGMLPLLAYIGALILRYSIGIGEAILSLGGKGVTQR